MQPSSQSFRLLPYLEWILLGLITLNVLLTAAVYPAPEFSVFAVLSIAAFGAIGFYRPTRMVSKLIYTGLEFAIILIPNLLESRIPPVPLLGLIAVIRGCQIYALWGRLTVAGLTLLVFLYSVFFRSQTILMTCRSLGQIQPKLEQLITNPLNYQLSSALSFGLTLVFAFPLVYALLAERQSRSQLAIAHTQLRRYAQLVEDQASLQERNRIAREMHDSLGHTLTAQSIQLENAQLFLRSQPDRADRFLNEAQKLSAKAIQDVQESVQALRSDPLGGKSLAQAIATLVEDFHHTTGIAPDCTIHLSHRPTTEIKTALYRIAQEALTNICKYSEATQVTLQLQESSNRIILRVEDNGRGFYPDQNTTGFGLRGMRERAIALGGQFTLVSQPGCGCHLTASIPISSL
ncbi:sensor histidine kinase [Phormidesmis sp. 146-35]